MTGRPQRGDAADYYFTYIDLVPDGDICDLLVAQGVDAVDELRAIPSRGPGTATPRASGPSPTSSTT